MRKNSLNLARKRINFGNSVNLIPEEFNADCVSVTSGRKDFDRISAHAEFVTYEINIVSFILNFNKLIDKLVALLRHSLP